MKLSEFQVPGFRQPIFFREGTSDAAIIRAVLIERKEYHLPGGDLGTILDIGANIGVTAVLMANAYPDAEIHAFEPVPSNLEILRENVAAYPNIVVHTVALGNETRDAEIFASDFPENFGGFSLCGVGVDRSKKIPIIVRRASEFLDELDLPSVDLIKIDAEGSEFEILTDLGRDLRGARFVMGEAHGVNDFSLFDFLSSQFDLSIMKPMSDRNYPFYAKRKEGEKRE